MAGHGLPNQSGQQSIDAHLSLMESVGFVKEDLQHPDHSVLVINRQDQEGAGPELSANRSLNPRVGLGILDTQNLASRRVLR
jgi:hypothetical protein